MARIYVAIDYGEPHATRTHAHLSAGYLTAEVERIVPHNMPDVVMEGARLMGQCADGIWAHQLKALGHELRLMPPSYVKPYVKRGKNDATDAEAVTRPTMRFVPVKSAEQKSVLMRHRTRDLLIATWRSWR
jgi:transposase